MKTQNTPKTAANSQNVRSKTRLAFNPNMNSQIPDISYPPESTRMEELKERLQIAEDKIEQFEIRSEKRKWVGNTICEATAMEPRNVRSGYLGWDL